MQSYLSQSFRNKRRSSDPIKKPAKIVAKENACIMTTGANVTEKPRKYDKLGYDRDMISLNQELNKPKNDQCVTTIKNLLQLTHEQRRLKINGCLIRTTSILNDFSFFREMKWV